MKYESKISRSFENDLKIIEKRYEHLIPLILDLIEEACEHPLDPHPCKKYSKC
jgi:hypothetical protein